MKKLLFNGETHEADKIVKSSDSITGYVKNQEAFAYRRISDFSSFSLADGQEWDLPEPSESQILGQMITDLELRILSMGVDANA